MSGHYILDEERNVIPVDTLRWAQWLASHDRRVALTVTDGFSVSTVFLGLDHRMNMMDGPPIVFETLCRVAGGLEEIIRYSSWDDAETGHKTAVRRLQRLKIRRNTENAQ